MSNETNKKDNTTPKSDNSEKKEKVKKDRGMLPYLTTPAIYCLIALIVVLPMFISVTKVAVNTVHKAQEGLVFDFNDAATSSVRFDNKTLEYDTKKISACEKIGVLKCKNVGISSDVYFGLNRVSLRDGVGISSKSVLDGYKSKLDIAGYSTGAFKGLNNISKGDIIVFETTDKIYEYKVVSNKVELSPESRYSTGMILSCDEESKSFSAYNGEKRYVVAEISSMRDKKGA